MQPKKTIEMRPPHNTIPPMNEAASNRCSDGSGVVISPGYKVLTSVGTPVGTAVGTLVTGVSGVVALSAVVVSFTTVELVVVGTVVGVTTVGVVVVVGGMDGVVLLGVAVEVEFEFMSVAGAMVVPLASGNGPPQPGKEKQKYRTPKET